MSTMNDGIPAAADNFGAHTNVRESSLPANSGRDYYGRTESETESYRAGIKYLGRPDLASTHPSSASSSTPIAAATASSSPFPSAVPSSSSKNPPHLNDALHQSYLLNWVDGKPAGYPQQSRGVVQHDLPRPNQTLPHNRWHVSVSSHSPAINMSSGIPALDKTQFGGNERALANQMRTTAQRWKAVSGSESSSILHANTLQNSNHPGNDCSVHVTEEHSLPIEQQTSVAIPSKRTFKEMLLDELREMSDGDGEVKHYSKDAIISNQLQAESALFSLQKMDDSDTPQSIKTGSLVVKLKMPPEGKLPKFQRFVPSSPETTPTTGLSKRKMSSTGTSMEGMYPLSFQPSKRFSGEKDLEPEFPFTIHERSSGIGSKGLVCTMVSKPSHTTDSERSCMMSLVEHNSIPRCPKHKRRQAGTEEQHDCDSDCFEEYDPYDDVEEVRIALKELAMKRPSKAPVQPKKLATGILHHKNLARKQTRQPFLSTEARKYLKNMALAERFSTNDAGLLIHKAFTSSEVELTWLIVCAELEWSYSSDTSLLVSQLCDHLALLEDNEQKMFKLKHLAHLCSSYLHPQRYSEDILNYLIDLVSDKSKRASESTENVVPGFKIYIDDPVDDTESMPWRRLLLDRELGVDPQTNMEMQNKSVLSMKPIRTFDEGSSDVIACSWTRDGTNFALGTTTYSDIYNTPGNLVLGNINTNIVKFLHGHNTPRPPDQGNAAILDPILHSTVTSVRFSEELLFSSSYDCTVKVWSAKDGKYLNTLNFNDKVVEFCLNDVTDRLAAAGCKNGEVSIFRTNESGIMTMAQHFDALNSTLYPSTMVWGHKGLLAGCLVVGYDNNIGDSESHHGDLRVYNVQRSDPIINVRPGSSRHFDVCMNADETELIVGVFASQARARKYSSTRSHVRIFDLRTGISHNMELDSDQDDLNKVTISPCGRFITSSGTDDRTILWDTRMPDNPLCSLNHEGKSASHQEFVETGVTFAAWTSRGERFLTGGSDGVVKVWDPRRGDTYCHDLCSLSGPITSGIFSPSEDMLLIGECTGKATLLATSDASRDQSKKFIVDRGIAEETVEEEISGVRSAAELLASGRVALRDVGDGMMHVFSA